MALAHDLSCAVQRGFQRRTGSSEVQPRFPHAVVSVEAHSVMLAPMPEGCG
jgi:hypothetical protein